MESRWKADGKLSSDFRGTFSHQKRRGGEEKRRFRVFSECGRFVFVMVVV
jgi:hypothetical protein